jgi:hypothetical protein
MNQLSLTLEPPKARRRDPSTSHAAAKAAERFQASHAGRILEALLDGSPMTANEIAFATGLTVVQVCRRLPEIEGVRVMTIGGQPLERDGFRVWMAF